MRIGLIAALACAALAGFAAAGRGSGSDLPPPPPLRVPVSAQASPAPARALDAIAHCESRGDPTAVSDDGVYRGKYQFDLATWRSVGGSGDPAQASEREQDRRARVLAGERGTAPWPVCGYAGAGS